MPLWVLSELNKSLFNFFWAGKRDLVRRDVMFQKRLILVASLLYLFPWRFKHSWSNGYNLSCFWRLRLRPPICFFGFLVPRIFSYLLLVLKYFLWLQRNDFSFRSTRPSAVGLLASIKARERFHWFLCVCVTLTGDEGERTAHLYLSLFWAFLCSNLSLVTFLFALIWVQARLYFWFSFVCAVTLTSCTAHFWRYSELLLDSYLLSLL